jgi:hypothetical protein
MYVFITLGLILAMLCIAFGVWLIVGYNRASQLRKITEQTKEDIISSYHHLVEVTEWRQKSKLWEVAHPTTHTNHIKPDTVLALQKTWQGILSETNTSDAASKKALTQWEQLFFAIASKKRYLNAHAKAYNAHIYTFPATIFRMLLSWKPLALWPTLPTEESWLPTDILYLDI